MEGIKELGYEVIALGVLIAIAESMLVNSKLKSLIRIIFSILLVISIIYPLLNAFNSVDSIGDIEVSATEYKQALNGEEKYYELVLNSYEEKVKRYILQKYPEVIDLEIILEKDYRKDSFAMMKEVDIYAGNKEMENRIETEVRELFKAGIFEE